MRDKVLVDSNVWIYALETKRRFWKKAEKDWQDKS